MKLPRQIMVNGDLYEVKFSRDLGPDTLGICDGDNHIIWIKTKLAPKIRWATFCHELLHAIEFSYSISIPHPLIHALDTKLADVLFDNWLVA